MQSLFCAVVPALQQTIPPGGVAVCPLSTVQYTCVADNELRWKENAPGTPQAVTYDLNREINVLTIRFTKQSERNTNNLFDNMY